jgi:very-short-patch-repair endonuclease
MSGDPTFICGRCQRELPGWKEVGDSGLCTECNDHEERVVWSTEEDEGSVTTTLESVTSGEEISSNGGSGTPVDTEADSTANSEAPQRSADIQEETSTESSDPEPEGVSTATGSHILDPVWSRGVDTSHIEEAANEARQSVQTEESTSNDPLDRKIDSWKEQLLDLTRRSNLVDFSATKSKTLPFHRADPLTVSQVLFEREPLYIRRSDRKDEGGSPADPDTLAEDEVASIRSNGDTENSLSRIELNQKRFQRERGVDSLFLALGTLRWYDVAHSDSELRAPLFLVQVDLSEEPNRDPDRHDYEITSEDAEVRVNPALRKMLDAERGIVLPPDTAFDLEDIEAGFAYVEEVISGFDRWYIAPEVILGIFDFSKFSLYTDLEENRQAVKDDALVRALNGDTSALPEPPSTPSASELDQAVSPAETFQVLDADSSQQEAIEAAKRGMSFVLQGPPGTGKSQTISNIIAEKMAAGETVLFVSEKQAALNVVKDRLDDVGLGRFCLEAHGEKANKKAILEDLGRELQSNPLQHPKDRDSVVSSLEEIRTTLNQYKERLFYSPPGHDTTAYDAFGVISKRDEYPRIDVSFSDPTAHEQSTIDDWVEQLDALASYQYEFDRNDDHPWRHTTLSGWRVNTEEMVRQGLRDSVAAIDTLKQAREDAEQVLDQSPSGVDDLREARETLSLLVSRPDVRLSEHHFDPAFFTREERLEELAALVQESVELREELTESYVDSFFGEDGSELHSELNSYGILRYVSPSYRRLKQQILSHATEGYSPGISALREDAKALMRVQTVDDELDEYAGLIEQLGLLYDGRNTDWEQALEVRRWIAAVEQAELIEREHAQSLLSDESTDRIRAAQERVEEKLDTWDRAQEELQQFLDPSAVKIQESDLEKAPLESVEEWLSQLQETTDELQEWIQYQNRRDEIFDSPIGSFLKTYLKEGHPADDLVDTFERNFYTQWLLEVYRDTDLESFSATEFDDLVTEFRQLDEQQQEYAKAEIQHRVTNRRPKTELQHANSSEQVTLRREIQKSRRHMPLRELFAEAPSLITDLKPCFMMSPLSVAQYVQLGTIDFDTVIFDEASQIMPQDAVSSLIRGEQTIVAGDSKQLPPTSFFSADVEAAEDVREDLESILDEAATVLPEKRLLWHYRSQTNDLIEFSNAKYYNGALQTFPDNSPEENMGVDFEYVEDGLYDRGGSSTNEPEARRVLELVREHIEKHSDRSLGVVAFSLAQAQAIRDVIEQERDSDPNLDAFVSEDDALDEFFIKNLENVQGDERDSLIFSIGYGPDSSGKVNMTFGALNKTGGERRLNVAVTRAKKHIQVVSSLQPGEIDLGRTGARGARDFKHYLEYAKNGGQALARSDSEPQTLHFDSEFEEAVYTELEARGFDVVTQVESSGYSIDLAIKHPDKPGKYVLGIECDGAAYHHSKTARDRDRTRQAVLEDLGWTIHRIWSPDWASNKASEVEEIESKVEQLVEGRMTTDGGVAATEIETVEVDAIPEGQRGGIEDHLSDWQEPRVAKGRDKSFDEVSMGRAAGVLKELVNEFGPIDREQAFRTTISRWHITRLGSQIKKRLNRIERKMKREDHVISHDGFLWPVERPGSIPLRRNTDRASRSIESIPLEELAYAGHLLLEAGTRMTREDLILEIARLYGYQRIGSNIKDRTDDAVDVLLAEGCAESSDNGEYVNYLDVDAASRLLDRVYG